MPTAEQYAARMESGLCGQCGKMPRREIGIFCEHCWQLRESRRTTMRNGYKARYQARKSAGICVNCGNAPVTNAVKCGPCTQYTREYGKNNRQKMNTYLKQFRERSRLAAIERYGGICACCGESDTGFLSIDHINNDGGKERKLHRSNQGEQWYRKLIKDDIRPDLQVLCFNCNMAKQFRGECPHQQAKAA